MLRSRSGPPIWATLAEDQHGAVTRAQLLSLRLTSDRIAWLLESGRFQVLHRGVYAAFSGPVPWSTRMSAAVLHAGDGAALGGRTALHVHGALDRPPELVELCVPHGRKVVAAPGLRIVSRRDLARLVQAAPWPPRVRVEEAVLDEADRSADPGAAVAVLLAAVQRRRTTPGRLAAALGRRRRHRWRPLLGEVLADAAEGVHSMLERRYLREVELPHGLPCGERNRREREGASSRYRDVKYQRWEVVVELDGLAAHPAQAKRSDDARNRGIVLSGGAPLVYGWAEVVGDPCRTAGEVGALLVARGWTGRPRRCGPGCRLPPGSQGSA